MLVGVLTFIVAIIMCASKKLPSISGVLEFTSFRHASSPGSLLRDGVWGFRHEKLVSRGPLLLDGVPGSSHESSAPKLGINWRSLSEHVSDVDPSRPAV